MRFAGEGAIPPGREGDSAVPAGEMRALGLQCPFQVQIDAPLRAASVQSMAKIGQRRSSN